MLRQLKIYYLFVSLPFIMLLVGATIFWGPIASTLDANPHPQINLTIFGIVLGGGLLIIYNATRLMREATALTAFSKAIHAKTDSTTLKEMANSYDSEIACLLQMIANSTDRAISHQEQAALEHEVANVHERLNKRNSLPSYLTGLLVGMGLLGTFIGLLSTLGDIGALIGSFSDLDMSAADPIVVFSNMIEKMKAPMASMAIAFSASMFGLLGSIILGLMMVGIRRFQGDVNSVLSSEVARHVEIALSFESISFRDSDSSIGCYEQPGEMTAKVLLRIEERLAEAARVRQRTLSAEIDDFKLQRAEMLKALTEQSAANNTFSQAMQQLGSQLAGIFGRMEQRSDEISSQLSDLTVNLAGDAKQNQQLLTAQLDEQKQLLETIGSYNIGERLTESARAQQRTLGTIVEDFKQQREEMLQTLSAQNEASREFRGELQQIGAQLGSIFASMEKGTSEISSQLSDLTVNTGADAKESQRLLSITGNNLRGELQQLGGQLIKNLDAQTEAGGQGHEAVRSAIAALQGSLVDEGAKSQAQGQELIKVAGQGAETTAARVSELMSQMTAVAEQGREHVSGQTERLLRSLDAGCGDLSGKLGGLMESRSTDARETHRLLAKLLYLQTAEPLEDEDASSQED